MNDVKRATLVSGVAIPVQYPRNGNEPYCAELVCTEAFAYAIPILESREWVLLCSVHADFEWVELFEES